MIPREKEEQAADLLGIRLFVIVTCVVLLLIAGCAWCNWSARRFFRAILVGETGPVTSCEEWPRPLKELLDEPPGIGCDDSTIQVYCLCRGFDPEYVWRMEARPGLFEQIEKRWELTEVDDPKWYLLEGYRSSHSGITAPTWWAPQDDGGTSFFVSPQVLAAGKSDRFHVALDDKRKTIFVHYWFNF